MKKPVRVVLWLTASAIGPPLVFCTTLWFLSFTNLDFSFNLGHSYSFSKWGNTYRLTVKGHSHDLYGSGSVIYIFDDEDVYSSRNGFSWRKQRSRLDFLDP